MRSPREARMSGRNRQVLETVIQGSRRSRAQGLGRAINWELQTGRGSEEATDGHKTVKKQKENLFICKIKMSNHDFQEPLEQNDQWVSSTQEA